MSFDLPAKDIKLTIKKAGAKVKGKAVVEKYKLAAGTKQQVRLQIDAEIDIVGLQHTKSPSFLIDLTYEVTDVAADGAMTLRGTFDAIDIQPGAGGEPVPAEAVAQAKPLVGTTMTTTLRANGSWGATKVSIPLATTAAKDLFDTISIAIGPTLVFPDQAIKEGSEWETESPFELTGVKMSEKTHYTVEKLDAKSVSVAGTTTVTGADQEVEQGGMKIPVTGIGGTGTTNEVYEPGKAIAIGNAVADRGMSFSANGRSFTTKVTLGVAYTSK